MKVNKYKVIINYTSGMREEYEFDTKEQMDGFVIFCNEVQTMQGGIRKITIIYRKGETKWKK